MNWHQEALYSPAVSRPMIRVPAIVVWITGMTSCSSASKTEKKLDEPATAVKQYLLFQLGPRKNPCLPPEIALFRSTNSPPLPSLTETSELRVGEFGIDANVRRVLELGT